MRAIAIIPARLASTRLPRKPLRQILGKPMIQRVYEAATAAHGLADVIIATDASEIFDLAQRSGWNVRMTSSEHRSGTDRVREVAQSVESDVYINVQGDEPLARPEHLTAHDHSCERGDVAAAGAVPERILAQQRATGRPLCMEIDSVDCAVRHGDEPVG